MREKGTYVDLPYGLYLELEAEAEQRDVSKKQVHIEALEAYLGVSSGESEAVIRRKLQRERRELRDMKEEMEDMKRQVETRENRVDEYEHMLEERESSKKEYQNALSDMLDNMESGKTPYVWETSQPVTDMADEHEKSPGEIVYDLKEMAKKKDREITNTQFMEKPKADQMRAKDKEVKISEIDL